MANTKTSDLTALAGSAVVVATDIVPIVDISVTTTKKITVDNLLGAAFTTAGDIAQASAAGVAARLGIGTAGQVPTVNAGATALAYKTLITIAAEQNPATATIVNFGSIPAGIKRIKIMPVAISPDAGGGAPDFRLQIGDAGGLETSGYVSTAASIAGTVTATANSTAGFDIGAGTLADASALRGTITLDLEDAAAFTWTASGSLTDGTQLHIIGGSKSLSAELTQLSLFLVGGTATFTGAISISYE